MVDEIVIASHSPERTCEVAAALGSLVRPGDLIGLCGDLGAGKTLFVQGLARGLGVAADVPVTSPTFTLLNHYAGRDMVLYHGDLYRLDCAADLAEIGLDEICLRADGVVALEWSDKFAALPADSLAIRLEMVAARTRRLWVRGGGRRSGELAATWRRWLQAQPSPQPAPGRQK